MASASIPCAAMPFARAARDAMKTAGSDCGVRRTAGSVPKLNSLASLNAVGTSVALLNETACCGASAVVGPITSAGGFHNGLGAIADTRDVAGVVLAPAV